MYTFCLKPPLIHRHNYYDSADALIYVLDSSDLKRVDEATFELSSLLDVRLLEISGLHMQIGFPMPLLTRSTCPASVLTLLHIRYVPWGQWLTTAITASSSRSTTISNP